VQAREWYRARRIPRAGRHTVLDSRSQLHPSSSRMTYSTQQKGKGRSLPSNPVQRRDFSRSPSLSSASSSSSSESHSSSESEFDSADNSEDEGDEEISQEYLDSLLENARKSIAAKAAQSTKNGNPLVEDIIRLDDPESVLKCVVSDCSSFSFSLALILIQGISLHWIRALYHDPTSPLGRGPMMPRQPFGT